MEPAYMQQRIGSKQKIRGQLKLALALESVLLLPCMKEHERKTSQKGIQVNAPSWSGPFSSGAAGFSCFFLCDKRRMRYPPQTLGNRSGIGRQRLS
eukprot:2435521-Amphidinium_carterae.1